MAVAAGFYDVVLAAGVEKTTIMGTSYATRTFAMASDSRYEGFTGITFPGVFAMMAHRYMKKYGILKETLEERMAKIAVKNHANAVYNPKAHFQKMISVETVLKSPKIADPLKLFDCCPFSDGAAAVVLATSEIAKRYTDTPIHVAGTGQASHGPLNYQQDVTRVIARELSARQAYKQAKLEPKDVDIVELHDCFTIAEIVATEGLGFFEIGKGHEAVEEGQTEIDGKIAVNPSGGLKAKGHPVGATGIAQVVEVVEQLREEAGKRQVQNAEVGMTDTLGGDLSTVCNIILRR
jgi:acetyl-CoA C-acetyltransferase/acetyl-CoA acyltransferase